MSLRKKFGTSKGSITEGAWIDLLENEDGTTCRLRIKRMNQQNPRYQKELANHRNAFTGDHYSEKKINQMQASMIEVLVSTIIVDWDNFENWMGEEVTASGGFPSTNGEGKYLAFTPENVRRTLIEFPDLLDLVTAEASDIANFQQKEDDAKN